MLQSMLEFSLGIAFDERDKYQSQVVDLIRDVLVQTELGMQTRVEDADGKMAECGRAKDEIEQKALVKQEELDAQTTEVLLKKRELAEVARAYKSARQAATRAQADCTNCEKEVLEAETMKEQVTTLLTDFLQPLRDGCDESDLRSKSELLMKSPGSRGPFDIMALASTEEALTRRRADAESKIRNAEPDKDARQRILLTAEAELKQATTEQLEAAAAYTTKLAEQDSLEKELHALGQALRDTKSETVKHSREGSKRQSKLKNFREGALNMYATLQEKRTQTDAAVHGDMKGHADSASHV